MSYWDILGDMHASESLAEELTVLLDGEPMALDDVTAGEGAWTGDIDAGRVRVTLKWNTKFFTHASARVGPDEDLVALDADSPTVEEPDPAFVPVDSDYEFEVELRMDDD
ncbi:hypothetical protein [Halorussus amylolyticus]|uniref:hypothetical protein n=1 Tax=Halorussus amylolyticus TaxID=1126242 RepID=UPI0010477DEB|nr:hypothetical protein [Halorussus amylolyticus]